MWVRRSRQNRSSPRAAVVPRAPVASKIRVAISSPARVVMIFAAAIDTAQYNFDNCRITAAADKLEVVDLKSTNGTFVNGKRVQKAHLADGDRLRVGRVELTVQKRAAMAKG